MAKIKSKGNGPLVVFWLLLALAARVDVGEERAARVEMEEWRTPEDTVEPELDQARDLLVSAAGRITPDVYNGNQQVRLPHSGCAARGGIINGGRGNLCIYHNPERNS